MKKVHLQEKICQNWIAMARMAAILDLCKLEKTLKGAKPAPGGFSLRNTLAPQIHQKIKVIPQFQVHPSGCPTTAWGAGADLGILRGGGGVRVQVCGNFHILTSKKKTSGGGGLNPLTPPPPWIRHWGGGVYKCVRIGVCVCVGGGGGSGGGGVGVEVKVYVCVGV